MSDILKAAEEMVAVAKGEVPAARVHMNGHAYVPETELARLRAVNAGLVANLERMLLEFDFLVERGVIPDVRNDIIFADARAAIASAEKENKNDR